MLSNVRKTKIICTMGPATDDDKVLRALIESGMNVARINMSHGTHEQQKGRIDRIKKIREELKKPVAILLDTKGPEIRTGNFKNGKELLVLKDSFANSIIPFLVEHYEKVHVIDPRFYKDDIIEYVKEHKNLKDVLILYNMNTIDTDLGIRTIN